MLHLIVCALLAAFAVGCGGDDDGSGGAGGGGATDGGPGDTGPLYAIMFEIYDDVGSTSYLSLLDTLDIEEIDLSKAREFTGGRAFIQTYGGRLYVGDAATPTVTRYSIDESGSLVEEGKISFSSYGLTTGQFDSWNATFIDENKAYLMDFKTGTTIIWNPTTMEIVGDIAAPDMLLREGLSLEGTPAAVRDGLLFRSFDWVSYDTATYSTDSLLAVYDVATDELLSTVTETRCPVPGNLVHQDEAGNIYFSNWVWPVAGAIMRGAPSPCVLRINAGEQVYDPTWTLDYSAITDGREGAMFSYLADGEALISVFYDERTSFDEDTDPWSYVGSLDWSIWKVDLDTLEGAPLEGIDFNGGAFTPFDVDDQRFLMVPGGEEESYATQVYEVVDGLAVPRVKLPGWSYQFVRLR
jgi:hypothetical protein